MIILANEAMSSFKELRPREKMSRYGVENLNDGELLSIILRTGYKGVPVEQLAGNLLSQFGTRGLFQFQNLDELMTETGLPYVKACSLMAISEYMRRLVRRDSVQLKSSDQFYNYIKEDFRESTFEQLRVVCLDAQRRAIFTGLIAQGQPNSLRTTLASIFHYPIKWNAIHFYLAHNHPRGNVNPSDEDIAFTLQVQKSAKLFGLSLDDHIIVVNDKYYSFSLKGLL